MTDDTKTPEEQPDPEALSEEDLDSVAGGSGPQIIAPVLGEAGALGEAI